MVVEADHQAIAARRPAAPARRKLSDCIATLPAESTATIEADFAGEALTTGYAVDELRIAWIWNDAEFEDRIIYLPL